MADKDHDPERIPRQGGSSRETQNKGCLDAFYFADTDSLYIDLSEESYSASRVEDRVDGDRIHRSWDQPHFVSAGAAHRGPNWEFSVAAAWHSGWPTTAVALRTLEPFPLVDVGLRNDERLGSYVRIDSRAARKFRFESRHQLTVYLEISNLANRLNDCCREYQLEDEEGPTFLDVEAVESLPLVPSLGVVWEF